MKKQRKKKQKRLQVQRFGTVNFALFRPSSQTHGRAAARIGNRLLMVLWPPTFLLGLLCFYFGEQGMYGEFGMGEVGWGSTVLIIVSSMVFHELGHACACLAYGGKVEEFGVMLMDFIPAAYVLLDYEKVGNRFKKAQIMAGGVEVNLLLSGISFFLAGQIPGWGSKGLLAGLMNLIMGFLNLALINGLDGMCIFSTMFSNESFFERAVMNVLDGERRRHLRRKGLNGKAMLAAGCLLTGVQIMLPLLYAVNILTILGGWL